ncbi:MAG: CoA-binding protein [Candidatus Altiarchaeota archaeon]|nr:CoA-binding protein [Candidatus Altiarchaeota archaeon]
MEEGIIQEFLNKNNIFVVVGASRDPKKYGHQVFKDLKEAGYRVYPLNPRAERILGEECYHSLRELPQKPDIVDVVVPPKVTEKIVRECNGLGIKKIWLQPGSESKGILDFCQENNIQVVHSVCVMLERKKE